MQPNEQLQHPIDYLDSISTAPKKPAGKVSDKMFFGIILGAVVILLAVVALIVLNSGPNVKDDMARLSVNLENLQQISEDSKKTLVSSSIRATNANLLLALTNANRDIVDLLEFYEINPDKISDRITEEENVDELTEKLEDARLNGTPDRVYAREMNYELGTLLVLVQRLEDNAKVVEQKEYMSTLRSNLEPLQKQFADFKEAS